MTFEDFQKTLEKKYVALNLSEKSQISLRNWCLKNGFDLTKKFSGSTIKPEEFDFHITIFFTSNEMSVKNENFKIPPIDIVPEGMKVFGQNKDTPVLIVKKTPGLMKIWQKYKDMGMKSEYSSWVPHISVSYNWHGEPDISKINFDGLKLTGDEVTIQSQL